ncbi:MAG: hypothetical protein LBQ58_08015 [Synergistaceae bacterium]|jgi:lipid-A-disaccharide synthase|nr:hypothetical protein [Synergistaceae bacterium]
MQAATKSDIALDLYITTNSPGEIAGWVTPFLRELRPRIWNCRTTIVILPCQYASGAELSYGAESGADRTVSIGRIDELRNDPAEAKISVKRRLVMHMGGDMFFSVYLSRKLKAPLWAYTARPRWGRFVNRYFVPDEEAAERFSALKFKPGRYECIGNLVLDSVILDESESDTRASLGIAPDSLVLTCLVGSRPLEYTKGIPLFAAISRLITEKFPGIRVLFPLAPTVQEDILKSAMTESGISWRGEERVREIELGGGRWGTVIRGRTLETLNCSNLAIVVPGTNNLQAAALYIPFIMVLPLDWADEYPLDGLLGVLPTWLPGIRWLKRRYITRLNEQTSCVSLPNKMAGRMIAPEVRGIFQPDVVARLAISLLESPERLKEMSRVFWDLTHKRGASVRLAERVAQWTREDSPKRG